MKTRQDRHPLKALQSAFPLALTLAAWVAFGPAQFGGGAEYVLVNGNSMEPLLREGDLVILRQTRDYQIGDVVTYQQPRLGPVIHRIIGREGARFILKGDHNPWVDTQEPVEDEILGEMWIHIPQAGQFVAWMRTPLGIALLTAALGGVALMGTSITGQRRPAPKENHDSGGDEAPLTPGKGHPVASKSDALFVLVLLLVASAALAWGAYRQPPTRIGPHDVAFEHRGAFTYSAVVPPGVYESSAVQTGEPVFREVADSMQVSFEYTLQSEADAQLAGTYRLVAVVSEESGWTRTIELHPSTSFTGASVALAGEFDLAYAQALVDYLENLTGIERRQYEVAFVPEILVTGMLGGQPFEDDFAPRLEFIFDETQLWLADKEDRVRGPVQRIETGGLIEMREEPNTLALLGLDVNIVTARRMALVGLLVSVDGLVIVFVLIMRDLRRQARQSSTVSDGTPRAERSPGDGGAGLNPVPDPAALAGVSHEPLAPRMPEIHGDTSPEPPSLLPVESPAQARLAGARQPDPDDWAPPPLSKAIPQVHTTDASRKVNIWRRAIAETRGNPS